MEQEFPFKNFGLLQVISFPLSVWNETKMSFNGLREFCVVLLWADLCQISPSDDI